MNVNGKRQCSERSSEAARPEADRHLDSRNIIQDVAGKQRRVGKEAYIRTMFSDNSEEKQKPPLRREEKRKDQINRGQQKGNKFGEKQPRSGKIKLSSLLLSSKSLKS